MVRVGGIRYKPHVVAVTRREGNVEYCCHAVFIRRVKGVAGRIWCWGADENRRDRKTAPVWRADGTTILAAVEHVGVPGPVSGGSDAA